LRNNISISLTLSAAAIALLLLASPLVLSNLLLLQPVQAQTPMTFKTPKPATYTDPDTGQEFSLTFDAQGTTTPSGPQAAKITNGTFQIDDIQAGKILSSGNIIHGSFTNSTSGGSLLAQGELQGGNGNLYITTSCSSSDPTSIDVDIHTNQGDETLGFEGAVECSSQGGGNTTTAQQSSSSMTGTTTTQQDRDGSNSRDSDGDGIPDSSDRCTHTSNPRCFKEGEASTTTTTTNTNTTQQQSSSSMTGNQTRDR
jgi:hypothetical protein